MRSLLLLFFLLFGVTCLQAGAGNLPDPGEEARCEVCGMFVAPYPQWIATLEMKDGRHFYFDGPKDLFICFFDLQKYLPGSSYDDVAGLFVTEYYTTRLLPAKEVYFITGSDVLGPMGVEMVPVAGREAAETFRRDHAGTGLMRFDGRELRDVAEQP